MLSWEQRWRTVCQGQPGLAPSLARGCLWALSTGYRAAVSLRNGAYSQRLLRSRRPPHCLIISVGNLVAGGTGKTPLTIKLAEGLSAYAKVAVLSRGYRSAAERRSLPTLIRPGEYAGDEPTMIARRLPEVLVFAGKNRLLSAQMAVEAGAEIILLDDGLQHRQLARDVEIIILDGEDPFGCGYYLPRGFLRDSPRALKRADLVVVNQPNRPVDWLRSFSAAPVVGMEIKPALCHAFEGGPFALAGKKVGLFCGIAKPEKFRSTAQSLGANVVAEHFLPDHAPIPAEAVQAFACHSRLLGAELLLCTEKDQVKLVPMLSTSVPIAWLQVDAQITSNAEIWDQFIRSLAMRCHNPVAMLRSSFGLIG